MVKGSELGYSLITIEKTLQLKQERNLKQDGNKPFIKEMGEHAQRAQPQFQESSYDATQEKISAQRIPPEHLSDPMGDQIQKGMADILHELTQAEQDGTAINPELFAKIAVPGRQHIP